MTVRMSKSYGNIDDRAFALAKQSKRREEKRREEQKKMRNTSPLAERNEHANIEPIQKSPKQATNIIYDNLKFAEETKMESELSLLHFDYYSAFFLLTAQSHESHQFTEKE